MEGVDEEVAAAAVFEVVLDSRGAIAYFRGWSGDRVVMVGDRWAASLLLLPIGFPFRGGCVQKRGGGFMSRCAADGLCSVYTVVY